MCLLLSLLLFGPRLVGILWWLADGARWTVTFGDNFLIPALGILFLPWTTIIYVLVFPLGIEGLDWLWLGLGAVADLGAYFGGGLRGRQRLSGYGTPP